jgi:hypothetical protein
MSSGQPQPTWKCSEAAPLCATLYLPGFFGLGRIVNPKQGLFDERTGYVTPLIRIDGGFAILGLPSLRYKKKPSLRYKKKGPAGKIVGGGAPVPKTSGGAAQSNERITLKVYAAPSSCQYHLGQAPRRDRPLGSMLPGFEEGIRSSTVGRQEHTYAVAYSSVR